MAFLPKQITQYQAEHPTELQRKFSEIAINYSLGLMPPSPMSTKSTTTPLAPARSLQQFSNSSIRAPAFKTDVNEQFVQGCRTLAETKNWPVDTAVMSAHELTYSNDTFPHSFTSFDFHCIGDHDTAAKRVYRTSKAGSRRLCLSGSKRHM